MKHQEFEDILIYFSKSLMGQENEEDILWDVAKNCISKLRFVDCVIYVIDSDNKKLIRKAAYTPEKPKNQKKTRFNQYPIWRGNNRTRGNYRQSGLG
ncbi:hypothetical protein [Flagellimonas okinawensis]|uniref:Uncharacterized protein n=1 Tax=Flagellimonas okinawensis TaxID=3031324 RepID=A0ABT5XLQ7_9FLAO|nr:hypothetical protein [[Muricauda] okinawensis]MDF0706818.1 hypothetical protein [[Muricauda] okinawensis]